MDSACEMITNPTEGLNQGLAPESYGLEPTNAGPFVIGSHRDLSGEGVEIIDFKGTKAELRTLAYQYLDLYFSFQYDYYVAGYDNYWDWEEEALSWHRFECIAIFLGKEAIKEFEDYITLRWAAMHDHGMMRRARENEPDDNLEDNCHFFEDHAFIDAADLIE